MLCFIFKGKRNTVFRFFYVNKFKINDLGSIIVLKKPIDILTKFAFENHFGDLFLFVLNIEFANTVTIHFQDSCPDT
jgi:hypothetical protein